MIIEKRPDEAGIEKSETYTQICWLILNILYKFQKIMRCDVPQHYQGDTVHISTVREMKIMEAGRSKWANICSRLTYGKLKNYDCVTCVNDTDDNERVNLLKDIGHI